MEKCMRLLCSVSEWETEKRGLGNYSFSSITVVVGEQAARIFGNRRGWSQALFVCNRTDEKTCELKFSLGGGQGERKERESG